MREVLTDILVFGKRSYATAPFKAEALNKLTNRPKPKRHRKMKRQKVADFAYWV